MKKVYSVSGIDCANCAAKLERRLKKIKDADNVSLNFIAQRLTVEADDGCFDEVLTEALDIIKKKEPDCRVTLG